MRRVHRAAEAGVARDAGGCSVNGTSTRKRSAQPLPPEIENRDRGRASPRHPTPSRATQRRLTTPNATSGSTFWPIRAPGLCHRTRPNRAKQPVLSEQVMFCSQWPARRAARSRLGNRTWRAPARARSSPTGAPGLHSSPQRAKPDELRPARTRGAEAEQGDCTPGEEQGGVDREVDRIARRCAPVLPRLGCSSPGPEKQPLRPELVYVALARNIGKKSRSSEGRRSR